MLVLKQTSLYTGTEIEYYTHLYKLIQLYNVLLTHYKNVFKEIQTR